MTPRGLNPDGTIAREGALCQVPAAFAPVVEAARVTLATTFGGTRVHSAYLYGSILRGTAIPGVSDLDILLAMHRDPTADDRARKGEVEMRMDGSFGVINGAGILLYSAATLLSDLERHDLEFFVACLCTPLFGPDLAALLPRYRPTPLLARETNGVLGLAIPGWRTRVAGILTYTERTRLTRAISRRLVRSGFTLVMPRWRGWTSDLVIRAGASRGRGRRT